MASSHELSMQMLHLPKTHTERHLYPLVVVLASENLDYLNKFFAIVDYYERHHHHWFFPGFQFQQK